MPYKRAQVCFWAKPIGDVQVRSSMSKSKRSRQLFKAGAKCLTECFTNCYFFMMFLFAGANI